MPSPYTRDPNSLDVLKKYLLPTGDTVSENVAENDPELALPQARSNADFAGNARLKEVLGLGPSRGLQEQRNQATASDVAVNQARIAANPEVSAEADKAYQEKLALAGEANRVTGAGNLAVEKQKQVPLMNFMDQQANNSATAPNAMHFKPTVSENGITFTGVEEPQQVRNQEHAAQVGLGGISALRNIVQTLDKHGSIGPVAGRFGEAATSSGLDSYLMSPEASQAFNDFKTQSSLVKSNMAMAHGGARGGASPALAARFDAMINPHQSAAALKGGLDAFERWLTAYANAKSSTDLDAADQSLGIGGQASSPDQYSDPHYQPK